MALKKTVQTTFGIDIVDAYHRVESVRLQSKTQMQFNVYVYADPSKQFVAESIETASYDIQGSNPIAQAYEYLKTMPEFADAVDC